MPEPQVTNIRKIVINKMTQAQYDAATKNADELYLTPDTDSLPSQTGQSGKYLKTNGTTTSWESVPAGTVTSVRVQATSPVQSSTSTVQSTSLNTTISLADGYGDTKNPYASKTANTVLAAPNGSNGAPSFRVLEKADIPLASETAASGGTTTSLVTTGEKYTWNNKQDTISDLSTIRDGASAGATAVQPGDLATVATSGSYNDLINKPTIPAEQVNSNWNATSGVAQILNKPTKLSDFTDDLGSSPVHTHSQYLTEHQDLSNYQTKLSSTNKLNADYIQDGTTNKVVTSTEKDTWNAKQNALATQTAYTSKGSATKVPQITTNTLGQVTGITEVTISQPTVNDSTITIQKNSTTVDSFTLNQSTAKTINISVPTTAADVGALPDSTVIPTITDTYSSTSSDGMSGKAVASAISGKANSATTLSGYGITDAYTKTEIDGMVSAGMHFKGTKASYSVLPSTGNQVGDMWNVTDTGANYAWDGTAWDKLSENIDLSGYVPTSRTINSKALTGDITLTASDVGAISSHQSIKSLKTDNASAQTTSSSEAIAGSGTINLHKISKTGNYNDLLNKPSIPSTASDIGAVEANTAITSATKCKITYDSKGLVTAGADLEASDIPDLSSTYLTSHQSIKTLKTDSTTAQSTSSSETITGSGTINLHKVAKTGSYSDLNNKPTIPATNVIPATTTANKVLVSTTTSGTAKWSDFNTAGLLKTNTSGVISVDTTSYGTYSKPSGGIPASDLAESYYLSSNPNGYTSNTGTVTSVRVQAGTGLSSSTSTAQSTTLNTTISIASGYKLPTTTEWSNKQDALPSQSGNSGKYLTTNGSALSWASVDALPSQSGQSGKFLTTNGTSASWAAPVTWTYNAATKTMEVD